MWKKACRLVLGSRIHHESDLARSAAHAGARRNRHHRCCNTVASATALRAWRRRRDDARLRSQPCAPAANRGGVATTALVTAAAGPISFIALVAPQIARRLMHTAGVSLLGAAAMGAVLLTGAHVLSLIIATFYRQIPVGLITVVIGGMYMLWLLIRESKRHYGTG